MNKLNSVLFSAVLSTSIANKQCPNIFNAYEGSYVA